MKNRLTNLIVIPLIALVVMSCSNQEDDLLKLENGLFIEVSLEDAFNSLEVYPPKADFDAEITLIRSDGSMVALNYPLSMSFLDGRYLSRSIPLPPADYRLIKFTTHRMEKAQLITAPNFAVTYQVNSPNDCTFKTSNVARTVLHVNCLSLSYLETSTANGSSQNLQSADASGFYLFINRCNADNRENYHEVLSYDVTAYSSDAEQNPVDVLLTGDNLNSEGQPEPIYIPLPVDYTNGIILQIQPIGEENTVLLIPVAKTEIDKYVNGEIDYVHLEVGCD